MKMFHYLPVSGLSNFAVGSVPGFDKKIIEGYWILALPPKRFATAGCGYGYWIFLNTFIDMGNVVSLKYDFG